MADLELDTPTNELKRPRDDEETLSEFSSADVVVKIFRADESLFAINKEVIHEDSEVAIVAQEQDSQIDFRAKEEGEGDATNDGRAEGDAVAKLLSGQNEDIHSEGGAADDGCDLDENGQDVETDDSIKEQAEEAKSCADEARGIEGEDSVEAHAKEVTLGPKVFTSSLDMFNYFYDLLRGWPVNFNLNKYEHMMLEDLLKKGHQDAERKIGAGIEAFQIRVNPEFYSRCYYVIQKDGSIEDFSYRKCVDTLMPLPDNMKSPSSDLSIDRKGQGGQHNNRGRGGRFGSGGGNHGRGNRGHSGRKRF